MTLEDCPITDKAQDQLRRERLVQDVVKQITLVGSTSGYVLGLFGPWGYGKTSTLNLVRQELRSSGKFTVIRFNPWLFAGSHDLVLQFLAEFASQLKADMNGDLVTDICDKLEEYSALVTPVTVAAAVLTGPAGWFAGVLAALRSQRTASKARFEQSALLKKTAIEDKLKALGRRIVVVIDDVDRLPDEEIRDVMRLVRLVGEFPNTTYLVACDRTRVQLALDREGAGQNYLDKIIQAPYDLPQIEPQTLNQFFTTTLNGVLAKEKHGPFSKEDWDNIYQLGIFPLLSTPRDVKRVCNGVRMALSEVGEEIAAVDIIALETIRVLQPALFAKIVVHADLLAPSEYSIGRTGRDDTGAQRFADITGSVNEHDKPAATQLLQRLFPVSRKFIDNMGYGVDWLGRWRKDRKVAHYTLLNFYLERQLPADSPRPSTVKAIFDSLGDEAKLSALMDALDGDALEKMFGWLEDFEDDFKPEMVESASRAILRRCDRLRKGRTHMHDMGSDMAVTRILLRLLKKAGPPEAIAAICERLLAATESFSWRLELVYLAGHHKHAGHKLVSEEADKHLCDILRMEILRGGPERLAGERNILQLLGFMNEALPAETSVLIADERVFLSILKNAGQRVFSTTMGDAAQRSKIRMSWPWLQSLVGAESLNTRVKALEGRNFGEDAEARDAVALAMRYVKGELIPNSFRDDAD